MSQHLYEVEATPGYESMEFEAKNATKYMATFPYPYMNGYLHMGKFSLYFCRVKANLDFVIRSRVLNVQGRVHDPLPALARKTCTLPLRLPLHRYAHLLSCHPSPA